MSKCAINKILIPISLLAGIKKTLLLIISLIDLSSLELAELSLSLTLSEDERVDICQMAEGLQLLGGEEISFPIDC